MSPPILEDFLFFLSTKSNSSCKIEESKTKLHWKVIFCQNKPWNTVWTQCSHARVRTNLFKLNSSCFSLNSFLSQISTLSLYWRISSPVSFFFFYIFGRTRPFLAEGGGRRGLCPRWNLCVVMWCAYHPALAIRGISLLHMTQTYGCVKADYPRLIREYDKVKKNGSIAKWAEKTISKIHQNAFTRGVSQFWNRLVKNLNRNKTLFSSKLGWKSIKMGMKNQLCSLVMMRYPYMIIPFPKVIQILEDFSFFGGGKYMENL